MSRTSALKGKCVCISGGTGANSIVDAFAVFETTSFVIPISDDGGSSSEVQRVLGGPSIGDIRSRLIRLIPETAPDTPLAAIRRLLEYRLGDSNPAAVKAEWHSIVEGRHKLWRGVPSDRKECIRAFLIHVEAAILRKASKGFTWSRCSIGNLFLSGASLFLGSVPSAIFLFASITEIPHDRFRVIPVINTNSTATIAAELEDGSLIVGQNEISHPSAPSLQSSYLAPTPAKALPSPSSAIPSYFTKESRAATPSLFEGPILGEEEDFARSEYDSGDDLDSHQPRNKALFVSKDAGDAVLPARISRIMYLNAYGLETFPRANPLYLDALDDASCVVYSIGSLYTSLMPCLALRGVSERISKAQSLRYKILLLNATTDRETPNYTALDFVEAIRKAAHESTSYPIDGSKPVSYKVSDLITHLVYLRSGQVLVDREAIEGMGISCIEAEGSSRGHFDGEGVRKAFEELLS